MIILASIFRPSSRQDTKEISQLKKDKFQESPPPASPSKEKQRKCSKERTDSLASSEISFSAQQSPTTAKKFSKAFVAVKVN
jgi:hypothetical protein